MQSQAINHYLGHPERRRSESASTWLAPTPGIDNYDAGINSQHDKESESLHGFHNVTRDQTSENMFVRDIKKPVRREQSLKHPYPNL